MADEQAMVEAFHRTFDIVVNSVPTVVDRADARAARQTHSGGIR